MTPITEAPATATGNLAPPPVHWAVRMNHRNRTGCSLIILVLVGLQLNATHALSWPWTLAAIHLLVYPHVLYRLALTSDDPLRTETWGMRIDALLLGLWVGALHFPLWMAVALFVSATLHPIVFRGPRGFAESITLLAAGSVIGVLASGGQVNLETTPAVTVLSIAFMAVYLLILTFDAYGRAATLAEVRRELRNSQQALQQRLAEIEVLQAQLSDQANRDPLTGLHNRRYLDATLERDIAQALRAQQPLSLLLLDIDHFKSVNDNHGHPAGDEVLRLTGELLHRLSRKSDLVCRFGGEEFVLLLPNTGPEGAHEQAEKIRLAMQASPVNFESREIKVEASIGLASLGADITTPQALVAAADKALYAAKKAGRNRVVIAGTECLQQ